MADRANNCLMVLFCIAIVSMPIFSFTGAKATEPWEWPSYQNDGANQGTSTVPGQIMDPGVLWKYYMGGSAQTAQIDDVNGDGITDMLMLYGGKVIVKELDGTVLWASKALGANYFIYLGDLDLDGTKDVVVSRYQYFSSTLFILSGLNGTVVWKYEYPNGWQGVYPGRVAVVDVDGDPAKPNANKLEIVAFIMNSWNSTVGKRVAHCYSFENGVANGHLRWEYWGLNYWHCFGPIVANVDSDPYMECIFADGGANIALTVLNGATTNPAGQLEYRYEFFDKGYAYVYTTLNCVDVDRDGIKEVIVFPESYTKAVFAFDIDKASPTPVTEIWNITYEIQSYMYGSPDVKYNKTKTQRTLQTTCVDLEGDGYPEVVLSIYNDDHDGKPDSNTPINTGNYRWDLFVFNASTGEEKWNLSRAYLEGLQDIDGDGNPEVVCRRGSSYHITYAYNSLGTSSEEIYNITNAYPYGYGDCTNDGITDIFMWMAAGNELNYTFWDWHVVPPVRQWSFNRPQYASINLLNVADFDMDGLNESILNGNDGYVRVLNEDGSNITIKSGGHIGQPPVSGDLNGDGDCEIVVVDSRNCMQVLNVTGANYSNPPTVWWEVPYVEVPTDARAPVIVDMANGTKRIAVAQNDRIYCYNYDGTLAWQRAVKDAANNNIEPGMIGKGYFNNDSVEDVLVGISKYWFYNNNWVNEDAVYAFDGTNGSIIWKCPLPDDAYAPHWDAPCTFDYSGDGLDEAFVGLTDYRRITKIDGSGTYQWNISAPGGVGGIATWWPSYYGETMITNLSDDLLPTLVRTSWHSISAFNPLNGNRVWTSQESNPGYNNYGFFYGATSAQVDPTDLSPEIGVAGGDGLFYCYNGNDGSVKWTYNLGRPSTDVVNADMDGDSMPEFIVGCENGKLYILNGENGLSDITVPSRVHRTFDFAYTVGSPTIVDPDRDSQAEIVVPVGSGYLYAIDQTDQAELFSTYEDIMFTDPSPYNTSTIAIFVTIYNEGGVNANNVTVSFFDGPSLIGNSTINVSKASNNYTYVLWHAMPSGNHTIVIKIDPNNEVNELSEENNIYTKKIYVRPIPEFWLTYDDVIFEPAYPKWGDVNVVNATVHNTGEISAYARVSIVDSSVGGELAYTNVLVPVGGAACVALQFTPVQPNLARIMAVVVDYGNKVFEMNETNNSVEYDWRYGVSIQCFEEEKIVEPGEFVLYNFTVTNTGTLPDIITIDWDDSSLLAGWVPELNCTYAFLAPYETVFVQLNLTAPIAAVSDELEQLQIVATSVNSSISDTEIMRAIVSPAFMIAMNCDEWNKSAKPGEIAHYNIRIDNLGNAQDVVNLNISSVFEGWSAALSDTSVQLGPKAYKNVTVDISIPLGTFANTIFILEVTGVSSSDETKSDSVTLQTTVEVVFSFTLTPGQKRTDEGLPGAECTFEMNITNTGNSLVNYSTYPGILPAGWSAQLKSGAGAWSEFEYVLVNALETKTIILKTTISISELAGTYAVAFNATDGNETKSAMYNVTVLQTFGISLDCVDTMQSTGRGRTVYFNLTVRNLGNAVDNIVMICDGVPGLALEFEPKVLVMSPNSTGFITLKVTAYMNVSAGDHTFGMYAFSEAGAQSSNVINVTVQIMLPDVVVLATAPMKGLKIGNIISLKAYIGNIGNISANFVVVGLTIDDKKTLSETLGVVSPNANVSVSFTWQVAAGKHTFMYTADLTNAVDEAIETNNIREVTVDVPGDTGGPIGLTTLMFIGALVGILAMVAIAALIWKKNNDAKKAAEEEERRKMQYR